MALLEAMSISDNDDKQTKAFTTMGLTPACTGFSIWS
jgi:hypothetical protein